MKTFNEWLKTTNESMFKNLMRSLKGEKLPNNLRYDQKDSYEKLRSTGMSHEEALRTVMDTPVLQRRVSNADTKMRSDIEGRWGNR